MPFLHTEIPWTEQPQEAVEIDQSNRLTRGLVRLLVPFGGSNLFDCVTGEFATRIGNAFVSDVSRFGVAARTTATSGSYWTLPVRSEAHNSMSAGRIGAIFAGGQALAMRDSTAGPGTILHWSNGGWDMRVGGQDYAAAGTHALSTYYVSLVTSSATAAKTFVGGQGLVINGGAPGGASLVSPWYIHFNPGSGSAMAASALIAIWDRALTDSESAEWLANPWQLFAPRVQRIWVPAAGGVLPTLSLPTFVPGSITATGFRPRVTAS